MMLTLYRRLTGIGGPVISLYLNCRLRRGKEEQGRFHERLGRPRLPRPPGPLVWLHAASIGESLSMLPLIARLLEPGGLTVLVTTGTVTSAKIMAERLPPGAVHQYVPVDRLPFVRGFLDHWKPGLVLWAESEFWPNMVSETAARRIPMVLLNGRVSERSFRGWKRLPGLIRRLLSGFTLCLGQTEADAERLRALGAPRAKCLGNLKFAMPPLPGEDGRLAVLREAVAGRPVWIAASTHDGEEAIAAEVHARLESRHPGLLTIIVPRHAQRGAEIADALRASGLKVALRSAGEMPVATTQLYLADTMGELGLFFRLARAAFVGKSLAGDGGQNPLEPARLGVPVLFGPRMSNFSEMASRMMAARAAEQVTDAWSLGDALDRLLSDDDLRRTRSAAAQTFATAEAGVLDAVAAELTPFLDALGAAHADA
jgi:3-deoxy-D-manno-octulosonic-acid transferase